MAEFHGEAVCVPCLPPRIFLVVENHVNTVRVLLFESVILIYVVSVAVFRCRTFAHGLDFDGDRFEPYAYAVLIRNANGGVMVAAAVG